MTEKPGCYGWVLETREVQERRCRVPIKDCSSCELLQVCTAAYNERVYNHWQYEEDDPENYDPWGENLDDEDWEPEDEEVLPE